MSKWFGVSYKGPITPLTEELYDLIREQNIGNEFSLEILNDDITNMGYVVDVLHVCFNYNVTKCTELMLKVHQRGSAEVFQGSEYIIKRLAEHIENDAKDKGFPLKCKVTKV